jgi:hypothetical protein
MPERTLDSGPSFIDDLRFFGADDGIRTRDPHLGKVPATGSVTCGDGPTWRVSTAFSSSCNPTVSRRFSVVDGTPTGPRRSLGGMSTSTTVASSRPSQKPTSRSDGPRPTRSGDAAALRREGVVSQSSPRLTPLMRAGRVNRDQDENQRTRGASGVRQAQLPRSDSTPWILRALIETAARSTTDV